MEAHPGVCVDASPVGEEEPWGKSNYICRFIILTKFGISPIRHLDYVKFSE